MVGQVTSNQPDNVMDANWVPLCEGRTRLIAQADLVAIDGRDTTKPGTTLPQI
jgi:hypothetical protein